jgi:hypothetical protein
MHMQVDPPPHVIEDEIGLRLAAPDEMLRMAREAGVKEVQHVSAAALGKRYFAGRTDGLRPPNNTEELLVATTEMTLRESETNGGFVVERNSFRFSTESVPCVERKRNGMNSVLRADALMPPERPPTYSGWCLPGTM